MSTAKRGSSNVPLGEPGASLPEPLPTQVEIGYKGDRVVMNCYGNDDVEPSYLQWTAAGARAVAAKLLECADAIDPSGGAWRTLAQTPVEGQLCAVRFLNGPLGPKYAIARYRGGLWHFGYPGEEAGAFAVPGHWMPLTDFDQGTHPLPTRGAN